MSAIELSQPARRPRRARYHLGVQRRAITVVLATILWAPSARADDRDPARIAVCIQPLGKHDKGLVDVLARGARAVFGVQVRTLEARPLPRSAWYEPRRRYRADKLLSYLDAEVVPGSGCDLVMGFTRLDISTTKDEHADWGIFGLASLGGPSGVVSTFRLGRRAGAVKKAQRSVKVFNHELGHALGVDHLPEPGCIMQDAAGTVRTVDEETGVLCATERQLIEERHGVNLPQLDPIDWDAILE